MPGIKFRCPECDALIRRSEMPPPGKKVRCPECEALVRPPSNDDEPVRPSRKGDDDDDRPRRSKSKGRKPAKKSNSGLLVVIPIVALVMIGLGGAFVWAIFFDKKEDPNAVDPTKGVVANNFNNAAAQNKGGSKGAAPQGNPNVATGTEVGLMVPEIEGEDLDGQRFKLSDYRGKVVLLDFWGNW